MGKTNADVYLESISKVFELTVADVYDLAYHLCSVLDDDDSAFQYPYQIESCLLRWLLSSVTWREEKEDENDC